MFLSQIDSCERLQQTGLRRADKINEDSSICQVEISSSGLEAKPLSASGIYPAVIACNITNGRMPHISNRRYNGNIPKSPIAAAKDILRILTAEPLSVTNGLTS